MVSIIITAESLVVHCKHRPTARALDRFRERRQLPPSYEIRIMTSPDFDRDHAHRQFAAEFNNAAWDLLEAPSRTQAEDERMLQLAHAALLHWGAVGTPANAQRGLVLLALAHAVTGQSFRAVDLARRCLGVGQQHDHLLTSFDRTAAAACMATALRSSGAASDAAIWHATTATLTASLPDQNDKTVINRLLAMPVPDDQE